MLYSGGLAYLPGCLQVAACMFLQQLLWREIHFTRSKAMIAGEVRWNGL